MRQLALKETNSLASPLSIQSLTPSEQGDLRQCESIIERGLATFVEVGNALAKIRDGRLYRGEYRTFEGYCQDRWGLTRRHVNYQIAAARVVKNLGTIVPILPITESQARPLTRLEPEQQREAWTKAVETAPNGKVTAAHVQKTVEAVTKTPHVSHNAGNNEWYTPPEYIRGARDVMGGIDLDPASTSEANEVVGATIFYTKENDGLLQEWAGKVWMNPPYASELIGKFVDKLVKHVKVGHIPTAIVLVNNATETQWFSGLVSIASAVCFPQGRVKFWAVDKISAPLQGQAVVYIGRETDRFLLRFQGFGWVARISK